MNEFIVWDKNIGDFDKDNFVITSGGEVLEMSCENAGADFYTKAFQHVGKKDINDRKIYADCSIIEFISNENDRYIVKWNKDKLNYSLYSIVDGIYLQDFYHCENFKIIDTIQENKLGLIK